MAADAITAQRNFTIMRLRCIYVMVERMKLLTEEEKTPFYEQVEVCLAAMNAEPQCIRTKPPMEVPNSKERIADALVEANANYKASRSK